MFEPEMVAFLQSGCSAIIGTVSDDGEPHAGRAWGLDVLPSEPDGPTGVGEAGSTVRVLIDADDELTVRHLGDPGRWRSPRRTSHTAIGAAQGPVTRDRGHGRGRCRPCRSVLRRLLLGRGADRRHRAALLARLVPDRFLAFRMQVEGSSTRPARRRARRSRWIARDRSDAHPGRSARVLRRRGAGGDRLGVG